ncbi:MAG: hypothetical protein QW459_01760 [Sulfolobales archaeon]
MRDSRAAVTPQTTAFPEVLRCGVLGVASNAPKPDENPSGMRGKEMRR